MSAIAVIMKTVTNPDTIDTRTCAMRRDEREIGIELNLANKPFSLSLNKRTDVYAVPLAIDIKSMPGSM
jgi:hypothetical protein